MLARRVFRNTCRSGRVAAGEAVLEAASTTSTLHQVLALPLPLHREQSEQPGKRDVRPLPPVEDRLDDVGRQQRETQHAAGVGGVDLLRRGDLPDRAVNAGLQRSEEHTSELQSLMRISYAV